MPLSTLHLLLHRYRYLPYHQELVSVTLSSILHQPFLKNHPNCTFKTGEYQAKHASSALPPPFHQSYQAWRLENVCVIDLPFENNLPWLLRNFMGKQSSFKEDPSSETHWFQPISRTSSDGNSKNWSHKSSSLDPWRPVKGPSLAKLFSLIWRQMSRKTWMLNHQSKQIKGVAFF